MVGYFFPFFLTNLVDPDEMPDYVAFHLDLHLLPKYALGVTYYVTRIQSVN